ncbi:diguanylate cyclase (GGDEF)-like protein [Rhizobium sp. BK251]|nr:diguanylate cyclase (GGDEF)-like protein [Rhizobium sp. BK251]
MVLMDNFAFLLPFFMTVFGVLFLLARFWSGVSATQWGLGFLAAAAGFCVPLMSFAPVVVQALLADFLFLAAFFLYGEALLVRFGKSLTRPLRLSLASIGYLAIAFAVVVWGDLRSELIFSDIACAVLIGVPVIQVVRAPRRRIDVVLVAICGLVLVETVTRVSLFALLTSSGDGLSLESYMQSAYAYYSQLGASIIAFLLALAVLGTVVSDVIGRYRHAAEHDALSLLLNRRGFDQRIPKQPQGAIVVGDIDNFKDINDRFGHAIGDLVISSFAELLRQHFPKQAIIARFGGEEFVAFLPDHSANEAGTAAEKFRKALGAHSWEGILSDRQISASFGVTAIAKSDFALQDAISRADAYLYDAKRNGRNRVIVEGTKQFDHIKLVHAAPAR